MPRENVWGPCEDVSRGPAVALDGPAVAAAAALTPQTGLLVYTRSSVDEPCRVPAALEALQFSSVQLHRLSARDTDNSGAARRYNLKLYDRRSSRRDRNSTLTKAKFYCPCCCLF